MTKLLPFFAILFCSCISYQHITIDSEEAIDSETGRYYSEGKGVKITYDFSGPNFPVQADIYNLSDSILFLDLASSVFTVNEKVVGNALKAKTVQYRSYSDQYAFGDYEFQLTEGRAIVPPDRNTITIPPGSFIRLTNYPFKAKYDLDKKHRYSEMETAESNVGTVKVKRYDFDKSSRILGAHFMVSHQRDFRNYQLISATFREEQLFNSGQASLQLEKPPSQRYTVRHKDNTVGVILLLGLLGAGIVAGAQKQPEQ